MKYLLKSALAAGITASVMGTASVSAADLPFAPGEGDFNWASYEELKKTDLTGQQVTVFGPWLGPDQVVVENVLAILQRRLVRMLNTPVLIASSSRS